MSRSTRNGELRLLLLTERVGLRALFDCAQAESAADADVAVVDVAPDERASVDLVRSLIAERSDLPVAALVCCAGGASAATVRELLAAGVGGLVDLRSTPLEMRDALEALAGGASVLHFQLGNGRLRDVLTAPALPGLQAQVLELVAQGLRDHEIAVRLHLSPHTVKHRVEQLRATVHARNRIELAAWAGRNGY